MARIPRRVLIGAPLLLGMGLLLLQARGQLSFDRPDTSPTPGPRDESPAVTDSADLRSTAPPPEPPVGAFQPAPPTPLAVSNVGAISTVGAVPTRADGSAAAASTINVADSRPEAARTVESSTAAQDRHGRTGSAVDTTARTPPAITGWISLGASGAPSAPTNETSRVGEIASPPGEEAEVGDDGSAGEPPSARSAAPQPPRLSLVPTRSTLAPGDTLWVNVVLTGGQEITSVPFHVRFDSSVLEYLGARTGADLPAGALQPILMASVNPRRPDDLAVGFSLAGSSGTYSGSGTLILLEFRAKAPGQAELLFESASVRGATGEPLAAQLQGCSVRVR